MDKLAAKLDMDPVEFRQLNAMEQGTLLPTGQACDSPAPVAELLRRVKARPLPPEQEWLTAGSDGTSVRRTRPARRPLQHHPRRRRRPRRRLRGRPEERRLLRGLRRLLHRPRVRMEVINGEPVATVHTAMAEVGQGGVTVHAQIARTELGVNQVTIHPADTRVGSAGSTSASRQTYVTGGAVRAPARPSGRRSWSWDAPSSAPTTRPGPPPSSSWRSGKVVTDGGEVLADLADVLEETRPSTSSWSGATGPPRPSTSAPDRATATSSTRSPRTARSSRSTPSSAWSRSSNWPAPRTSARRSTRSPSSARSRAAPSGAWAWR